MAAPQNKKRTFFLIAGEPSGDMLGASLMRGLKDEVGANNVQFVGVGGPEMAQEGLESLFPMSDLSVMGVAEILPRLGLILRRISETVEAAAAAQPDAVISIDSPDFSFRVQRKLRRRFADMDQAPQLVHYVAPTVWAWRPGRARKIAGFLDHLLALFPFEPPYFEREGLSCDFVGHPVVTAGIDQADGASFRKKHDLNADQKLLCLLPGSRMGEVSRLVGVFAQTIQLLRRDYPDLAVALPLAPSVAQYVRAGMAERGLADIIYVEGHADKHAAFMAGDAALAASGTVSLELAAARLPHVIGYRVSALTGLIGRWLISTPYANLVNVILNRLVVPELLQGACTPARLAENVGPLLANTPERAEQLAAFDDAISQLNPPGGKPGREAARSVLKILP